MNINDLLEKSDLITDKILSFLDAKSLAYFGTCCHEWRSYSNNDKFWFKLCEIKHFIKYDYLIETKSHPSIPIKTTTTSPTFSPRETQLSPQCKWRQIFDRSMHLVKNWKSGIYFVAPVIKAHKGRISAFDSNRSLIISGSSDDNLIKVWSIQDMEMLNCFKSKTDSINCIKIYEEYIVVAGDDGIIKIYDIVNGDLQKSLSNSANSKDGVTKFFIADHRIAAVYTDKSIKIWCLKNCKLLSILRSHTDEIECLSLFKDILASGSWDQNITLWDLNHGTKLADLAGHTEVINCLKIKDYTCIVSAGGDSIVKIWKTSILTGPNKKDRLMINSIDCLNCQGHTSDVYCLETCGEYIVSGGADSLVIIWNYDGDLLYKLSGHLGIVRYIYIDEHKLVTAGDAKRIIVWDYKNGKLLNTLHRNPNKINFMNVNDTQIITASPDTESNITLICYW